MLLSDNDLMYREVAPQGGGGGGRTAVSHSEAENSWWAGVPGAGTGVRSIE